MMGGGHWWWNRGLGSKESAGYTTVKGQVLNGDQLWTLMEGLEANGLLHYTHLLTGAKFTSLLNLLNLCIPGFIAAFTSHFSVHILFTLHLHSRVNIKASQNSWFGSKFFPIFDIWWWYGVSKWCQNPQFEVPSKVYHEIRSYIAVFWPKSTMSPKLGVSTPLEHFLHILYCQRWTNTPTKPKVMERL